MSWTWRTFTKSSENICEQAKAAAGVGALPGAGGGAGLPAAGVLPRASRPGPHAALRTLPDAAGPQAGLLLWGCMGASGYSNLAQAGVDRHQGGPWGTRTDSLLGWVPLGMTAGMWGS